MGNKKTFRSDYENWQSFLDSAVVSFNKDKKLNVYGRVYYTLDEFLSDSFNLYKKELNKQIIETKEDLIKNNQFPDGIIKTHNEKILKRILTNLKIEENEMKKFLDNNLNNL